MESKKKTSGVSSSSSSFFQMPLHYPRYTKKDYLDMPEGKLDRLLADYGLPVHGNLASKREFAMGAFLWPDHHLVEAHPAVNNPRCLTSIASSCLKKV